MKMETSEAKTNPAPEVAAALPWHSVTRGGEGRIRRFQAPLECLSHGSSLTTEPLCGVLTAKGLVLGVGKPRHLEVRGLA